MRTDPTRTDPRARYILIDRTPVLEPDHDAWRAWMDSSGDELRLFHAVLFAPSRSIDVSTWFLGFDHLTRLNAPYLFCTMVTLQGRDDVAPLPRYCASWAMAARLHELVLERIKGPSRGVGRFGWLGRFAHFRLDSRRSL